MVQQQAAAAVRGGGIYARSSSVLNVTKSSFSSNFVAYWCQTLLLNHARATSTWHACRNPGVENYYHALML